MKDGSVTLTFEKGKVTGATVDAGFDEVYRRMFTGAQATLEQTPTDIEASIRLVVFGCLWLEARCNSSVEGMLHRQLDGALAAAIWAAIDRRSVPEKMAVLAAFGKDRGLASAILGDVRKAFALRNRLVHYKKEPVPLAGVMELEEVLKLIESINDLPEVDLVSRLRPPSIIELGAQIQSAHDWMESVSQQAEGTNDGDKSQQSNGAPEEQSQ